MSPASLWALSPFDGVKVDGRNVRMHIGTDGGPDCTDDYHPRTFVVEVGRDQLPAEGFWLTTEREGRFVLTASPQHQPPTGPSMLRTMTAEAPRSSSSQSLQRPLRERPWRWCSTTKMDR